MTGTLTVRDRDGILAHLPAAYVQQHTTLAYAVTSYGAQGQTVYSSHSLVDQGTTRAGVYVPGSRGTDANTFYVICQHAPDHHDPERIDRTPVAVLTDILTRPVDRTTAAEIARRAGADETRSLAWVGTQWDLLTAEYSRHRATDTLTRLLPADVAAASGRRARLRPADGAWCGPWSWPGTTRTRCSPKPSPAAACTTRTPSPTCCATASGCSTTAAALPNGRCATATGPPSPHRGPARSAHYAQVLAAAATARQTELGDRAAADPPAWALAAPALGPAPTDPLQRAEWVRRAGIVAAYRDLHAIPETQLSIGEAPSRERAFHHALWRQALTALGHPADALDYATASDAELREMRDAWRRAQAWEPQFVAADLHNARELAEEYRRDAVIWRAGLDRHPVGSPERDLAERDVAAAEHLPRSPPPGSRRLERIQAVRTDWLERTRELQERAAFAGDELERRGLDRDTADPVGEQQELFTIGNGEPAAVADADCRSAGVASDADAATSAAQTMRGLDPAQRQFDLDGVATAPCPRPRLPSGWPPSTRPPSTTSTDAPSVSRDETTARAPVGAPSWPWTTRSMPPANRCRSRRSRPHRTGMPSCSPRPNGPPNGNGSSPPCSRCNPRPSTSRPRSHCTSTTLPATRRAAAQSTPPPSGPRTRPPSRTPRSPSPRPPGKPRSSPRCVPNSTPEQAPWRARPSLARPTRTTKTSTSGHPATTSTRAPTSTQGQGLST